MWNFLRIPKAFPASGMRLHILMEMFSLGTTLSSFLLQRNLSLHPSAYKVVNHWGKEWLIYDSFLPYIASRGAIWDFLAGRTTDLDLLPAKSAQQV